MSFRICGKVIDVGHCLYNIAPMRKLIPFVNHPLKMEDEQQAEEKNKRKERRCKKRPDGSSSRFPDQPDDRQADQEKRKVTFGEILDGGKHFYPDESNGGLGNDLLVEYSLLWNDTLQNFNKSAGGQTLDSRITNKSGGGTTVLAWMSYQDNAQGSDCPFMGGFEWGALGTPEDGTSAGMCGSSGAWADYPNIGGADRENPEWGWHRVQIRVHQELTNAAEVASGASAVYYMYSAVYIDGVQVSKLSETGASPAGSLLFTAANDGADGIAYTDIADDSILYGFNSQIAKKNSGVGYLVYGDYSVSCGRTFAQSVTRVDSPAAATYVTRADGGVEIPAPAYFTIN